MSVRGVEEVFWVAAAHRGSIYNAAAAAEGSYCRFVRSCFVQSGAVRGRREQGEAGVD